MFLWVIFFALLGIGLHVSISMGLSAFIALLATTSFNPLLVPQRLFTGIDSFPLLAVPFFILTAEIMTQGKLSDMLLRFALAIVGPARGGLGHASIGTMVLFSGISGSALASAAGPGAIMIRMMRQAGYKTEHAAGITAAGAIIDPIIPPSIIMVIYALLDNSVSVGALFLAGIVPGLMLGAAYMTVNHFISKKNNYSWRAPRPTLRVFLWETLETLPTLMLPVIIVGGIQTGAFTPTEASAVAVFWGLAVALGSRSLKVSQLPGILVRTALMTSAVLLIVSMATLFAWLLAILQIPQSIAGLVTGWGLNAWQFLLFVMIFLFFVGMLVDTLPAVIILVPILGPLATSYGIDPIHFALTVILNITVGMITPPVGAVLFVITVVAKVPMDKLVKAVLPYLGAAMVVLTLITFVPWFSTALPYAAGFTR